WGSTPPITSPTSCSTSSRSQTSLPRRCSSAWCWRGITDERAAAASTTIRQRADRRMNVDQKDVVFLAGARTPMTEWVGGKRGAGKPGGALASGSAHHLGATAAKEAGKRAGLEPADIEHVIMGNALQTSGDALYGARHVALKAGMPKETPALTVNRLCGSGIQSIVEAAHLLKLGEANLVVAG